MKKFLVIALLVTLATACNSRKKTAEAFVAEINAVYGEYGVDGRVSFVKLGKDDKDFAVIKVDINGSTTYAAIDLSNFEKGQGVEYLANYLNTSEVYVNLTANGNGTFSCGVGCQDNMGNPASTSMVFEKSETSLRDMETAAAFVEEMQVKQGAENLSEKFALSMERAVEVASMLNQWNKISKTRSMTDADADAFALEAMGSKVSDVQKAFQKSLEGDSSELNSLIERAAEVNGISSENMNQIVSELFL